MSYLLLVAASVRKPDDLDGKAVFVIQMSGSLTNHFPFESIVMTRGPIFQRNEEETVKNSKETERSNSPQYRALRKMARLASYDVGFQAGHSYWKRHPVRLLRPSGKFRYMADHAIRRLFSPRPSRGTAINFRLIPETKCG